MSLLLDARKKSQQAQSKREAARSDSIPEAIDAEEHAHPGATGAPSSTGTTARSAGQNLFNAKSPAPARRSSLPNRNLLFALGGTLLLLGIGAAYLWQLDSASNTAPLNPAARPPSAPITMAEQPAALVPGIAQPETAAPDAAAAEAKPAVADDAQKTLPADTSPAPTAKTPESIATPIRIERQRTELLDPLLRDAYIAYQSGRQEEAQQLYLAMFRKDPRNADALLGLAAIAQQRGEDQVAAQYYGQVLVLDPRNALANAGMSSLSADIENNESRLKLLLREQGNSAALHFALGNLYAGQSRWGEAQQAYFNAWTLESGNPEYAFNLAVSLDHLGQGALAAQHYQRALQLDPSRKAGLDHTAISKRVQQLTQ